ncbi:MAG: CPBP family intramembrane metalloprotease [Planctomycetaceae bacterium]|nr:CPBP family intramembrane metalloprotease [Planctomycetaceae bacterium]
MLKELRETFRDTRTVGTLFLMPLLVYPLISLLMQNFIPRDSDPETTAKFQIGLDSEATHGFLRDKLGPADASIRQERAETWLRAGFEDAGQSSDAPELLAMDQHIWPILVGVTDYRALVSEGAVDLVLKLNAPDKSDPTGEPVLEMIYDPSSEFSRAAAAYIGLRVERYNLMRDRTARALVNLPSLPWLKRLEVAVEPAAATTVSFATLIPLILIMMTITGAVYPAIDLTAGERERGTLESLMAAPVPRVGILAAKYVAVWLVAMLTASLNVVSMLVTLWVLKLDAVFLGSHGITLPMVMQIFALLSLFAFFFSSVLLVVTSAARSFKEAQAYLIPLMMLSLTPGALALMPNLQPELWMSLVPMVNLVLLARDVMLETVVADFAWLSVVSTILYSAAALSLAAQVFGSDAVLYGSQGSWRELLQRNRTQRIPSPAFAFLVLALLFPTQFVMLGIMGRLQAESTALLMVGTMTFFTLTLFLILPVVAVLWRGFALVPTFALRCPSWTTAVAGTLLGVGLWPLVALSLWALSQWRAWMLGTESTAWSSQVVQLALQQTSGWSEIPIGVLVVCLAIVPAVCEEWFFRGLLLQSLRQKNREWIAIVLSSLAFGLFHFIVESSVAPLRFLVTASLGMILGWVCIRSGSLWPSVLLHAMNNGILTALALSRASLQDSPPDTTIVASILVVCLLCLLVGFGLILRSRHSMIAGVALILVSWVALSHGSAIAKTVSNARPEHDEHSGSRLGLVDSHAAYPATDSGLPKVCSGFKVTRYAGDDLAHDIHCMAIGPDNEVYVAGPGYLRQLLDTDADGVADKFEATSFQPRQGAQGLLVEPECLWVVADDAIWQVPRTAGQKAVPWLTLPKTGGEHDFHAVKRGTDGWLYFIAGNGALIDRDFITTTIPIPRPQAGVLGRISPDGRTRQVLVHGLRNAYDFDFDLDGSFLIYDSDDERDAGLPWYRPTTLVSAYEGADIGWVSRCFKKPNGSLGSAAIRAETGRGSPTGVAVQRRAAWGAAYFGAAVFADWTFGRIYIQPRPCGARPDEPEVLIESQANVAFAPTAIAFDNQGRLWIATGGRNTAGSVYVVERAETSTNGSQQPPLESLAKWFATNANLSQQSSSEATRDLWSRLREQEAVLAEVLEQWAAAASPEQLQSWQTAGQRIMRRDLVLGNTSHWESSRHVDELRGHFAGRSLEWAEAVTWLAMAGIPSTPATPAEFAAIDARYLMALSVQGDEWLWQQVGSSAQGENSERKSVAWWLAALAHRDATGELSAEQGRAVSQGFANELQQVVAGKHGQLHWADWFLIWRWALRSPVPTDGQTGPWDFMRRQVAWTAEPHLEAELIANLTAVWANFPHDTIHPAPTVSDGSVDGSAQPDIAPKDLAETWQRLLEIQLLLGLDMETLPSRWQKWSELSQQRLSSTGTLTDGWDPVERTRAMVLLAAIPKPWPESIDPVVVDYLMHVDRQQEQWHISTDRNWQQRFDELGGLLCLDHPTLAQQLAKSSEWERVTQIPVITFLPVREQQQVVAKLLRATERWDARSLEPELLDQLTELVNRWRLRDDPGSETAELSKQVVSWIAKVREQHAQMFKVQRPAWSEKELVRAVEDLETKVKWDQGDAARGKRIYAQQNCQLCHGQNGRLGPSLAGVSRRFQRGEILKVILNPDSRITDRYRPLWIQKVDGTLFIGRPVYESTDAIILEDQQGQTWQLARDEIEWSRPAPRSLMPTGLMDNASAQDWADLWAYLTSQ